MHTNYFFLRQLTRALEPKIRDGVISECFSQSKDELILRFELGEHPFFLRANMSPAFSGLSFPRNFQRSRKNNVDLFHPVVGRRFTGVRQFDNERAFEILLSEGHSILFKMHGNRSNVLICRDGVVSDIFRKNLAADLNLDRDSLDRTIDWSREHFIQHLDRLPSVYFTFGKVVWLYMEENAFPSLTVDEKWEQIQGVLRILETPSYHLTYLAGKPVMSLLPIGEVARTLNDPIAAANDFFYFFNQQHTIFQERSSLLGRLKSRLEAGENYCRKNTQRLDEVLQDNHHKVWADLIMANLHTIEPGSEKVVVENFYDDQRPVEIRLRKDIPPQKMAEIYYRKAKNQHIEIERLEQSIRQKQEEMAGVRRQIAEVEQATDLKTLRMLEARYHPTSEKKEKGQLPYHEFQLRDFRIWVGRNAQANDELTLKYGYKDDLWLHAKDVSGSHVLIKHQAGKPFPKDVIEFAASLAAANSKRKNESLCPVIVTPRKFVRKRKGDPAGAVVVEREEVVMVEPAKL